MLAPTKKWNLSEVRATPCTPTVGLPKPRLSPASTASPTWANAAA